MTNTETLNDLIKINNDRVEGYQKAMSQTSENDLHTLFNDMVSQSQQFLTELKQFVQTENDEPAEGTTLSGKIYRTWMDVKATFGEDDRKGLLASCEFGEDAAQTAYKTALEQDDITGDVRQVIEKQKKSLKDSHDKIRNLRDAAK